MGVREESPHRRVIQCTYSVDSIRDEDPLDWIMSQFCLWFSDQSSDDVISQLSTTTEPGFTVVTSTSLP